MKNIPQWRADRRPIWTSRFLLWWGDGGRWGRSSHRPSVANALISSRPREMLHSSVAITFPKLTRSFQSTSTFDFNRLKMDDNHAQLQTALLTYHKKFPFSIFQPFLRVDLVSTFHIADKEYFATLQKELEGYDCVLYEMVASRSCLKNSPGPGKQLRSSKPGFCITGFIQRLIAKLLRLHCQFDCLDYQADNWYHADLDNETFELLQLEKDIRNQSEYPESEGLSRLDFCAAMKLYIAKMQTSEFAQVTTDVKDTSVLVGERNRAATEALRRAIDGGNKKIAILYGVGHMPDLGRRLREEFDLVPSQLQWITAWSIKNRNLTSSSFQWPLNRYSLRFFIVEAKLFGAEFKKMMLSVLNK
ncbi:uncharacterized protein LOC125194440 isoform X2 [Salvia hispanica]|uniref:uncharacterized protein LOC125194440 isoform X2 n=1 Tax=Salvia hispanica TaxID=49212 RepID=UPI00200922FA|nr:uncharacterized protein LOC125194440 isoform X2 [Salvia hispanica]